MSIFKRLFNRSSPAGPLAAEQEPVSCEQLERRRSESRQAYNEEHLFGYVDVDGNVFPTPREARA